MAHSRCLTCKARVWREGDPADHLRDLCPGCGGPLEPVNDLSELVGLRSLRARPRSAGRELPDRSRRIAAEIRETIARHDAERRRRADGGSRPDPD
jgi:NAD-dependent SIR2 family protein deacetylase